MKAKNMCFRVDGSTYKKFGELSKKMGISRSQVLRLIVETGLKNNDFIIGALKERLPLPEGRSS